MNGRRYCTKCQRLMPLDGGGIIKGQFKDVWICVECMEHRIKQQAKSKVRLDRKQITLNAEARRRLEAMRDMQGTSNSLSGDEDAIREQTPPLQT